MINNAAVIVAETEIIMIIRIKNILNRTVVGKQAVSDEAYRTALFALTGLVCNLIFALYNGVLGIFFASPLFFVMFIYYTVLSLMRFYAVTYKFGQGKRRSERSVMRFCGALLIILAAVLSAVVWLNIESKRSAAKHDIIMISIAAYTFWKATLAIINIVKARKKRSLLIITLRNINAADAAASLLSLEHSMVATFGEGNGSFAVTMDAATGAGTVALVSLLGIGMLLSAHKKHRAVEK